MKLIKEVEAGIRRNQTLIYQVSRRVFVTVIRHGSSIYVSKVTLKKTVNDFKIPPTNGNMRDIATISFGSKEKACEFVDRCRLDGRRLLKDFL